MLKFRVDTPESRQRQQAARREDKSPPKSSPDTSSLDDKTVQYTKPKLDSEALQTVTLSQDLQLSHETELSSDSGPLSEIKQSTETSESIYEDVMLNGNSADLLVTEKKTNGGEDLVSTESHSSDVDSQKAVASKPTKAEENRSPSINNNRKSSVSSEYELAQATLAKSTRKDNINAVPIRKWSIPDTDSEDDFARKQQSWAASKAMNLPNLSTGKPMVNRFNLPSDSEEEDPYATAMSPSMSIKSAEPPLPPPVSTIPRTYTAMPAITSPSVAQQPEVKMRTMANVRQSIDMRIKSITSASDTDPYDEIDYDNNNPIKLRPVILEAKENPGQSEPRYKFTLSKAKSRLNPESEEITYAEIPKKTQWNFPSSSDDDDNDSTGSCKQKIKKSSKSKTRVSRQDSSTSDEGEKPLIPPKLWEMQEQSYEVNGQQETEGELRRSSSDSGIRESREKSAVENDDGDDITIEYSALHRPDTGRKGSLLGPDDNEDVIDGLQGSTLSTHSSGFGENNDMIDESSVMSENSSKAVTDYEQSSTCVDMDQLSLDSSGKRPKRIVETHETHEIVPADNNEDDIVERIIETQTITEKLDDNHLFKEYGGEDFSKYLDDDDEFVSHIYTLGRTMEKGGKRKDRKSKDFAFVENPFSAPEPVIETMPLEKKTVKQKITTLVKKKKAKDDECLYAEVQPISYNGIETDHIDRSRQNSPLASTSFWENNEASPGVSNGETNPTRKRLSNEEALALSYQSMNEIPDNNLTKITEKRKEPKTEKKSILKGIRRLLKKKDKGQDNDKGNQLVVEDDYQEFVP